MSVHKVVELPCAGEMIETAGTRTKNKLSNILVSKVVACTLQTNVLVLRVINNSWDVLLANVAIIFHDGLVNPVAFIFNKGLV